MKNIAENKDYCTKLLLNSIGATNFGIRSTGRTKIRRADEIVRKTPNSQKERTSSSASIPIEVPYRNNSSKRCFDVDGKIRFETASKFQHFRVKNYVCRECNESLIHF